MTPASAPLDENVVFSVERLREVVTLVLARAGADDGAAAIVADSLVESDLCGMASHGVVRIPDYLRAITRGRIDPRARPEMRVDRGAVVSLDGRWGFGQVAARELASVAAERAAVHGVALTTLAGVEHVGRLGEWVERAAGSERIAMAWCNCGDPYGNVVPYGGAASRLGTNPIAYAIPTGIDGPLVADFSTSIASEGKVRVLRHRGRPVPDGWLLDAEGRPTNDAADLYTGGALLPAGEHKGFALGLLVELLGGVLAGAGCASLGESPGNGVVLVVVNVTDVVGSRGGGFQTRVAEVLASVKSAGANVRVPGEPEQRERERRRQSGIPLPIGVWSQLVGAAAGIGLNLEREPATGGDGHVI